MAALANIYLDTAAASEEDRLWGETVSIRRGSSTTTGVTAQKWLGMRIINLDQLPADATHIRLIEGGLDRQLEIIRLIGALKVEVVEYR